MARDRVQPYSRSDGPLYQWKGLRNNRRTVTIPERVSPHVRLVFSEMARLRVTYDELEESSSVRRPSVKAWRRKNKPGFESLEAVLNSLGWTLTPTPALEILPPEIAADMAALSTKMKVGMPETWAAVLDWMARQHNQCITADQRLAEITRRREAEFARRRAAAANDNRPQRRTAKAAASAT